MTKPNTYQCINGPVFIRSNPDDSAQVISVCRKGTVIVAERLEKGLRYFKNNVKDPILVNDIWIKTNRGYVRRVSMLGTKTYFEPHQASKQYPQADRTLKTNDVVMIKSGTTDAYNLPMEADAYEPNLQNVFVLDSSRTLALLGFPHGISKWVPVKNLVLVARGSQSSPNFTEEDSELGN